MVWTLVVLCNSSTWKPLDLEVDLVKFMSLSVKPGKTVSLPIKYWNIVR